MSAGSTDTVSDAPCTTAADGPPQARPDAERIARLLKALSDTGALACRKTGYHRIMTGFPEVLRTVTALEIFRTTPPGL